GGKILFLVIDGVGGAPDPESRFTELETARLCNFDALAARSSVGRISLLPRGWTPGSGPGHLSLFGYDPLSIDFGRGVLEALGSEYTLAPGEIAARGNFCTVDKSGRVTDRRAHQPSDEKCRALCAKLSETVRLTSGEFQLLPGKEHRFTLVLRGSNLGAQLNDSDPQVEGLAPLPIQGKDPASERSARFVEEFLDRGRRALAAEPHANGMLLRGFSKLPPIEPFLERYRLRAAALAVYPMYRGVARLVGMDVLDAGHSFKEQLQAARQAWNDYDYFYLHVKEADMAGHAGDFQKKVAVLEALDGELPQLLDLGAEVVVITGDHSTPCMHREHSWHPVPLILHSRYSLPVTGTTFSERGVLPGELGTFPAQELMTLALAHAGRLDKYGA
ncbi:MAG: 2,3-bisphosphoglycerate-independent phosphoglycerate mutase, partial [Planctomycetota bacterium]